MVGGEKEKRAWHRKRQVPWMGRRVRGLAKQGNLQQLINASIEKVEGIKKSKIADSQTKGVRHVQKGVERQPYD
eukprot:4253230-Karenia_brevis.AAC.1